MNVNMCPSCLCVEPQFAKIPRNIAKLLEQFKVKCRYFDTCQQTLDYKELKAHELECTACQSCQKKCPKCSQLYGRTAEQAHMDVCNPPKEVAANSASNGFFSFFSGSHNSSNQRKQLVSQSQVEVRSRIVRRNADGQPLADEAEDDDYVDPDEQRRLQMEFINAVQDPSFWQRRTQTLMQYYPTLSQNTASFMLMVMLVDPILQNAIIVFLIGYLNEPFEEGGCCVSKSIYRAYITFVCAYLLAWMFSTGFTTA